jgi:hypothetical protein
MLCDLRHFIETQPAKQEFVLQGLKRGIVGSIVAPGGTGKSMLALQLAIFACKGVENDLMGWDDENDFVKGEVGYLSAEDGAEELHKRVFEIAKHLNNNSRQAIIDNIKLVDLTKEMPDLLQQKANRYEWFEALEEFCKNKIIVFVDTLRSFHNGDENNGAQMSFLVNSLRAIASKTNCSIVFLHHTNKNATLNDSGDTAQASRGSSVLTDNIRWQGFLTGMSKKEAELYGISEEKRGYFVKYGISKQNYGSPFAPIWLKRIEGGVLEQTTLFEKLPAKTQQKKTKQVKEKEDDGWK